MEPLYLVDGSGYIYRAFYAVAPLSNSNGLPTNALLGFTRMLMKLLNDVQAHYIAVTFDRGEKTFRHEKYEQYKANRKEMPEELVKQIPYFRQIVKALGMCSLDRAGVEADDIIATLTKRWEGEAQPIVIVSGDKDLSQLVNPNVHVWDAMRDIRYTEAKVEEKFGVPPRLIADYLALIGDTSDNVPGVKGIGPKTAVCLIQAFGGLEQIIEAVQTDPKKIEGIPGLRGAASIRQKLESGLEQLRLSYELVQLTTDLSDLEGLQNIDDLLWHGVNLEIAQPLFDELEFTSILNALQSPKFQGTAGRKAEAKAEVSYDDKEYHQLAESEIAGLAASLRSHGIFAFDTETTGLNPRVCELVGISISYRSGEAFFVSAEHLETIKRELGPIFADEKIKKVGFNLKFDISVLEANGISVNGSGFDGMLATHILNPDRRGQGLKALTQSLLGESMMTFEEMLGGIDDIRNVEADKLKCYACHDADATWRLYEIISPKLGERAFADDRTERPSIRRAFEDIETPLVPVLSAMELAGIRVDPGFLEQLGAEFGDELRASEQRIYELAGTEFNINSPKQLSEILFERLGLPTSGVKRTQTSFSTDASVLSRFEDDFPIARELLGFRELHKLKSTYVDALIRMRDERTGRIHTSFNQAIAATGRLSSTDPNLQNIPIRNPRGRKIRQAFIAANGHTLISADYSQIELRVLAHLANDENLIAAFHAGEDIHRRTAKEIFGDAAVEADADGRLRRAAKTINFGVVYGIGAFRLARDLGITRKDAQAYIDGYFARYPNVRRYFDRTSQQIEEQGYVETMYGRRRYVTDIDTSGRDAGYVERSLLNAPIQGSAAEIMKLAMINLHQKLARIAGDAPRIVLQVHDELVVEAREGEAEQIAELVQAEMENAVSILVPLKVDVGLGRSWGDTL